MGEYIYDQIKKEEAYEGVKVAFKEVSRYVLCDNCHSFTSVLRGMSKMHLQNL